MKTTLGIVGACVAALAIAGLAAGTASAMTITFTTPSGQTVGGQPVDATATVTTSANKVAIVLTNLEANPTSAIQNLSGFTFTIPGFTTDSIISSSGKLRTVNGDHTFTEGGVVSTGWGLATGALGVELLGFNPPAPSHTIIGPADNNNLYSNAGGSIAESGKKRPHNPFLDQSAAFDLNVTGVTDRTNVTSATFAFGTTLGNDVTVVTPTPEPGTLLLLGPIAAALGGTVLRRRGRGGNRGQTAREGTSNGVA